MGPVLFDLSRQAMSLFAAHFLRSLSQPDTRRSRDAWQSSINVLPRLQENALSQPCRLLQHEIPHPHTERALGAGGLSDFPFLLFPPSLTAYCRSLPPTPLRFRVSYGSGLSSGIALVLQARGFYKGNHLHSVDIGEEENSQPARDTA